MEDGKKIGENNVNVIDQFEEIMNGYNNLFFIVIIFFYLVGF